jgi:hypothetical protein
MFVFALGLLQLGDVTFAGAFLFGAANLSLISVFYVVAIFVSRVLICIAFGRVVLRVLKWSASARTLPYVNLAVGALLLALAFALPVVGWLFSAVCAFLGLGAILANIQGQVEARRQGAYVRTAGALVLPAHPEEARQFPPPILDSGRTAPGMENLPTGFHWWDDD